MKRMAQKEDKEPEISRKGLGHDEGMDDLKPVIQSRQKDAQREMGSLLAQREARYYKSSKAEEQGKHFQKGKEII